MESQQRGQAMNGSCKDFRELPEHCPTISFADVGATWAIVIGALGLLLFSCVIG